MSTRTESVVILDAFFVTLNPTDETVTIQEVTFDEYPSMVTIPARTLQIIVREVARAKRDLARHTSDGGKQS